MTAPSNDDELVRRSLAGEVDAFAQLVERYQRLVYGVALSNARDVGMAEDLAQEAFVEAWRDLPRLRDPSRVGTWIAGIARNLAHGMRRHATRRQRREEVAIHAAPVATPLDQALARETQGLLRDALAALPEAYRETLVLYYLHGESVAQVAASVGITEELVKQRMSRGRRSLRAALEKQVETALAQLRPSKGFTAAVLVAVSSVTMRKAAAAGKMVLAMKTKSVAVGAAILVAGAAAWYGVSSHERAPSRSPTSAVASETRGTPDAAAPGPRGTWRKLASREARAVLLQAIRRARERAMHTAAAAASASRAPSLDEESEDLDKDYVRESVRALLPLITDCYESALETQPGLAGTLVVNFTIEGEPGVGGLVTESTIDAAQSGISDVGMGHCVQDAMFSLEIDPPTSGGMVKVSYPFSFQPGADG